MSKTQINIVLSPEDEAQLVRLVDIYPEFRLLAKTAVVRQIFRYGAAYLEAARQTTGRKDGISGQG